ncbi:unnamed protein product [marine sediment metagenome]|uniref:Uncharacterized protein n=1 Tax=marine sediment metagenome TaxID=412755 RepID=X0S7I1_9ZZZZ
MGATRDVALNELPIRGLSINADAAGVSVTVAASDSGVIFVNKEDAGTVTYTLPEVADCKGKWFWFYQAQTGADLKILGGTADVFIGGGAEAGDYMDTNATYTGNACIVVGDGTSYYLLPLNGQWDTGNT